MSTSIPLLDSPTVRRLCAVKTFANLLPLVLDYLVAAAAIGIAVWFHLNHRHWGLHWAWHLPVWGAAAVVNGCVFHRIGLMGHEASHNLLVPSRKWNDILAELLCFYPVFGSLLQYRAKHLAHHLYPNDPEKDPNLGNGKAERLYAKFPMPRCTFIYQYYVKFFWPPFVLANLADLLEVITIGSGLSPVPVRDATAEERKQGKTSRLLKFQATLLGLIYFVVLILTLSLSRFVGWPTMWKSVAALYSIAFIVWSFLPESAFFRGARLNIPVRHAALLRFTFYTVFFSALGLVRQLTGFDPTLAFLILWILPLVYVFPYLMLLREVYQHANAGQGQIDNSRIILADPFTRWALLGYGNDLHLIHHIYPNVPQYALRETHDLLMEKSPDYREGVEITDGVIRPRTPEKAGLLDALAAPAPLPHQPAANAES